MVDQRSVEIPVTLSSQSVYPLGLSQSFSLAEDLGYDGMEVMVTHRADTQQPGAIKDAVQRFGMPVHSVHAPTLLLTQQVWGSAWQKIERSAQLARDIDCDVVVAHPPFRWQGTYASGFADGIARIEEETGVMIAVENMYPWRARGRTAMMYLPHWDPIPESYPHVTWDFSHAATAEADSYEAFRALGRRLRHVHLTDGLSGGFKDDHLIPGHGEQRVAECMELLVEMEFTGAVTVEVSTRTARAVGERERILAESLDFARKHLGQA